MSATVADILADLIEPAGRHDPGTPAATIATAATSEDPCGLAGNQVPCDTLRQVATRATNGPLASQLVAACRTPTERPIGERWRGLSQVSQVSQGGTQWPTASGSIAAGHRSTIGPPSAVVSAPSIPTRPHKLEQASRTDAHARVWDATDIGRFLSRVAATQRRGFEEIDAEDLAERMHLLDEVAEGRSLCLDCLHLGGNTAAGWRCGNHLVASVSRDLAAELVTQPQRCKGRTAERSTP